MTLLYESHISRSSATGEQDRAFAAFMSVGIGWLMISLKNSRLRTMYLPFLVLQFQFGRQNEIPWREERKIVNGLGVALRLHSI